MNYFSSFYEPYQLKNRAYNSCNNDCFPNFPCQPQTPCHNPCHSPCQNPCKPSCPCDNNFNPPNFPCIPQQPNCTIPCNPAQPFPPFKWQNSCNQNSHQNCCQNQILWLLIGYTIANRDC